VPPERFRTWSIVTSVALGLALIAVIIWGVALATSEGGRNQFYSYVNTAALAALGVAGGWIIAVLLYQSQSHDRRIAEARQKEDLERSARSAVTRSFRIMAAMGGIQTQADGESNHSPTELRVRMRVINETARMTYLQAYDAIEDWRRFAPDVVDSEIEKAEKASVRRGEGWND
jgi:hypothetical protein